MYSKTLLAALLAATYAQDTGIPEHSEMSANHDVNTKPTTDTTPVKSYKEKSPKAQEYSQVPTKSYGYAPPPPPPTTTDCEDGATAIPSATAEPTATGTEALATKDNLESGAGVVTPVLGLAAAIVGAMLLM